MLKIENLTKRYGGKAVVTDLSFCLKRGQRFGLLGPNGAGKTTTISMIVGALEPDTGTIHLDGNPLRGETDPLKRRIGYVPQEIALYEDLTAADNLRFFGALYGLTGEHLERRLREELEAVELTERATSRVRTFSGGMKRRLNIAAALLHEPEILILDEPTVGVDPQSRNAIFERIERMGVAGMTLLYTTHYMEEVERLCDRVAIMDSGRLIAHGTQAELRALLPSRTARLTVEIAPESLPRLCDKVQQSIREIPGVLEAHRSGEKLILALEDMTAGVPAVLLTLNRNQIAYTELASERPHLEEVFLHLTGRSLRDE
jgi:ABC-2 type transport system ATP-binding protein